MTGSKAKSWLRNAVCLNAQRRKTRFAACKAEGAMWMLECRDLWDAEDDDAGVYFVPCASGYAVDAFIGRMDPLSDRLMGIYDLGKPLAGQGPGISQCEWLAGRR